jgi:monofunctional biosynthetic peptidoglycan transglycosylase
MRGILFIGLVAFWFIPFVPGVYSPLLPITQYPSQGTVAVFLGPWSSSWTDYENISPYVGQSIVVAEDSRFWDHLGLDFYEIQKSVEKNLSKKTYARGGSTLTQQTVKMLFLTPEKTLIRKTREALGALLLEQIASKEKILGWYLNTAEFGQNIYGVKEAARYYFGTSPKNLSLDQAIQLALVLPSPKKWSEGLKRKRLTPFGKRRFAHIARQMELAGYISPAQRNRLMETGNFGYPLNLKKG